MKGCIAVISSTVTNNGWLIIGIVFASLAAALAGNRFSWQSITVKNGLTALIGGVLLGWSSMIALGCTVGVLLSGTQAFAVIRLGLLRHSIYWNCGRALNLSYIRFRQRLLLVPMDRHLLAE